MRFASFGSISSGTMRPEDLIPCFAAELDYLVRKQPKRFPRKGLRALIREAEKVEDFDSEESGYVLEELYEALDQFAPPYAYFGSHPGDGADYGFWLVEDLDSCFDGLKVSDTSEVPRGYRGEVLHINDHGNMTLYVANGRGKLREVWGLV